MGILIVIDVYATAKVLIFQQITTDAGPYEYRTGCLCHCKGTNFLANHNLTLILSQSSWDVYATAKVLIFQQITTFGCLGLKINRCLCHCKGTNFLANHNRCSHRDSLPYDVYATAKVLIFQQITTRCYVDVLKFQMFMPLQRY